MDYTEFIKKEYKIIDKTENRIITTSCIDFYAKIFHPFDAQLILYVHVHTQIIETTYVFILSNDTQSHTVRLEDSYVIDKNKPNMKQIQKIEQKQRKYNKKWR
jgi:hypothetical protein